MKIGTGLSLGVVTSAKASNIAVAITATGGSVSTGEVNGILYKFHVFSGSSDPGTFEITALGEGGGANTIEVWGAGGGGAGGRGTAGSGGSAGSQSFMTPFEAEVRTYEITGGARGGTNTTNNSAGNSGSAKVFDAGGAQEMSWAGGAGGDATSANGGSGGGGAGAAGTPTTVGGNGGAFVDISSFVSTSFATGYRHCSGGGGYGDPTRGAGGGPGNAGRGGTAGSAPDANNANIGGGGGGAINGQSGGGGGHGGVIIRYRWLEP